MLKTVWLFAIVGASILFVSCQSLEKVDFVQKKKAPEGLQSKYSPLDDGFSSKEFGEIELVVNKDVLMWIDHFRGRGRRHMKRYLERSTRYMELMKNVLKEEGLPANLVYLPIIESGFNSHAHSHASAVGYWQFIHSTGKRYGLRINNFIDERRDPVASTYAAAAYLKALYTLFGDWYLALASYNTGENRIKRAVMKYSTRDFWKLAKGRRIPRETRNYVPKFLAAMIIARNPEEYGFKEVVYQPSLKYETVKVTKSISLDKLAKNLGLNYKDVKSLNPMFRSDYVPVNSGDSESVRIPVGFQAQALAAIPKSYSRAPKIIPQDHFWYRVRRGDTLSGIAHRNRTRISTLRRINGLGRRSFLRIGQRLKVPNRIQFLRSQRSASSTAQAFNGTYHTVRRGENLSFIASRYRTSVAQLRRWNGMGQRSLIRTGQKLKVKNMVAHASRPNQGLPGYHTVRRGENIYRIARKYGLSMDQILRWNKLNRKSVVFPGQKLRLTKDKRNPSSVRYHIVRRGENLTRIARKYGISVSHLAQNNGIAKKSILFVGRKLRLP